jgi:hypothetical protein
MDIVMDASKKSRLEFQPALFRGFGLCPVTKEKRYGSNYYCEQNKKDANAYYDKTPCADSGFQHGPIMFFGVVIHSHVLSDRVVACDIIRFSAAAVTVLAKLDGIVLISSTIC